MKVGGSYILLGVKKFLTYTFKIVINHFGIKLGYESSLLMIMKILNQTGYLCMVLKIIVLVISAEYEISSKGYINIG